MVDWAKRIEKACAAELGGERVDAGLFVQPSGTMGSAVVMGVGGVVGSLVAEAAHRDPSSGEGIAAGIPKSNLVLGLTPTRLVAFGHSPLSGKPKGLQVSIPLERVVGMTLNGGGVAPKLAVAFGDGTVKVLQAPRIGDPARFVAAFERRR
jgi:hypothetical protein